MQVSGFKAKGDDMESWERKRREERCIVREGGGERTQIGFDHLGHWKQVICIGLKLGGRVCAAICIEEGPKDSWCVPKLNITIIAFVGRGGGGCGLRSR